MYMSALLTTLLLMIGSDGNPTVVASGLVDVEQGVVSLRFQVAGEIARVLAKEGRQYDAGSALAELNDRYASNKLARASNGVQQAKCDLERAQSAMTVLRAEQKVQKAVIASLESKEAVWAKRLDEIKNVDIPTPARREREDALLDLHNQIAVEKAKLAAMEAKEEVVLTDIRQASHLIYDRESIFAEAEMAKRDTVLRAPCKGTVLRVHGNPGELMLPASPLPLIEFQPAENLIVRAEVQQEFAAGLKPGQKCQVFDDSRSPGQARNGTVARLSGWFTRKRSVLMEPLQLNDTRTIECIVSFDSEEPGLRIGQRMRVVILTGGK